MTNMKWHTHKHSSTTHSQAYSHFNTHLKQNSFKIHLYKHSTFILILCWSVQNEKSWQQVKYATLPFPIYSTHKSENSWQLWVPNSNLNFCVPNPHHRVLKLWDGPSRDNLSPLPWCLRVEGVQASVDIYPTPQLVFSVYFYFFILQCCTQWTHSWSKYSWSSSLSGPGYDTRLYLGPCYSSPATGVRKHSCLPTAPQTAALLLLGSR